MHRRRQESKHRHQKERQPPHRSHPISLSLRLIDRPGARLCQEEMFGPAALPARSRRNRRLARRGHRSRGPRLPRRPHLHRPADLVPGHDRRRRAAAGRAYRAAVTVQVKIERGRLDRGLRETVIFLFFSPSPSDFARRRSDARTSSSAPCSVVAAPEKYEGRTRRASEVLSRRRPSLHFPTVIAGRLRPGDPRFRWRDLAELGPGSPRKDSTSSSPPPSKIDRKSDGATLRPCNLGRSAVHGSDAERREDFASPGSSAVHFGSAAGVARRVASDFSTDRHRVRPRRRAAERHSRCFAAPDFRSDSPSSRRSR